MLNYLVLLLIAILHGRNTENIRSIVNSRLSLLRTIKPVLNHHCAVDLLCGITAAELHNSYSVALTAD